MISAPEPAVIVSEPKPALKVSSPLPPIISISDVKLFASILTLFVVVVTALASTLFIPVVCAFEAKVTIWELSLFRSSTSLEFIFVKSLSLMFAKSLNSSISIPLPPITLTSTPNWALVNLSVSLSDPASR